MSEQALNIWREKLEFFLREEALASDPSVKFQLRKQIQEAQAKLAEFQSASTVLPHLFSNGSTTTVTPAASSRPAFCPSIAEPAPRVSESLLSSSFDVFLSHNSQDKPAVRALANALKARGLTVWLDEEQLVPGRPWQEALELIIETTHTAAVLVGKDGLGPWQSPEMRACLFEFVNRRLPVIPVLLPGAPTSPRLPGFLRQFTWVDLRTGISKEGLDRLEWGITDRKADTTKSSDKQAMPDSVIATELTIFISYAPSDSDFFRSFAPTAKRCEREYGFKMLSDQVIPEGVNRNEWIADSISSADILLCVISEDYLAYIARAEAQLIENRCKRGGLLIPIYFRHCRLDVNSIFFIDQGINGPSHTLSDLSSNDLDHFFHEFEQDIVSIAKEISEKQATQSMKPGSKHEVKVNLAAQATTEGPVLDVRYNVVIVGRTGTGKSALINYLFGRNIQASGAGLPITAPGFHRLDLDIGGVPSTIFDSWGLETATANEWLDRLSAELNARGVDKPVQDWFHTIVYCVQASSHRVEPFELAIFEKFKKANYRLIIAFTKSDAVSDSTIQALEAVIHDSAGNDLVCIPICSIEEVTRTGKTSQFGISDLVIEIRKGFWKSITSRVPSRCVSLVAKYIDSERNALIAWAQEETGYFNHNKIVQMANDKLNELAFDIAKKNGIMESVFAQEFEAAAKLYQQFEKVINHSLLDKDDALASTLGATTLSSLSDKGSVFKTALLSLSTTAGAYFAAQAGAYFAAQTVLGSLGLSLLSLTGPLAIVIGAGVATYRRLAFLNSLTAAISTSCDEMKNNLLHLEPELIKHISDLSFFSDATSLKNDWG